MAATIRLITALVLLAFAGKVPAAEVYRNELGMRFLELPSGRFTMGTQDLTAALFERPDGDRSAIADEAPAHTVVLSRPFFLGETEVTQGQWHRVMGTRPGPSAYWDREGWRELPVVSVSWHMARQFAEQLSSRDPKADYRLPTEAEWEYAARAGSRGLRPFPKKALDGHAWYIRNSMDVPQPVATRRANAWGLYDMLGNAWEWVADWYAPDYYERAPRRDPAGPSSGERKVRRGGSYHCPSHLVRPGYRGTDDPGSRYSVLGLRLVAEPEGVTPPAAPE